jgi:hypothetical protein
MRKVKGRPRRFRCALRRESKIKGSLRLINGLIGGIRYQKKYAKLNGVSATF